MSDDDLIRRGDAMEAVRTTDFRHDALDAIAALPAVSPGVKPDDLQFPPDWRERAHSFRGNFKLQAAWSDGFNAARGALAALAPVPQAEAVEALVKAIPCGGCGNDDPAKRCIGCFHDFGTPDSAWVKKYAEPQAEAVEGLREAAGVCRYDDAYDCRDATLRALIDKEKS